MLPESQLEENGLALLTSLKPKQFTLAEDLILTLDISYCMCFRIQHKSMIFRANQGSLADGKQQSQIQAVQFQCAVRNTAPGGNETPVLPHV